MTNSTVKGKKGERKFCRKLREHGYGAVRAAQVDGHYTADVLTSFDEIAYFEVKRTGDVKITHQSEIEDWIETVENDRPTGKTWVIAWRPDHGPWLFFVDPSALRALTGSRSSRSIIDDRYLLDTPYVLLHGFSGLVSALDPEAQFTVANPDDWTPPNHV